MRAAPPLQYLMNLAIANGFLWAEGSAQNRLTNAPIIPRHAEASEAENEASGWSPVGTPQAAQSPPSISSLDSASSLGSVASHGSARRPWRDIPAGDFAADARLLRCAKTVALRCRSSRSTSSSSSRMQLCTHALLYLCTHTEHASDAPW